MCDEQNSLKTIVTIELRKVCDLGYFFIENTGIFNQIANSSIEVCACSRVLHFLIATVGRVALFTKYILNSFFDDELTRFERL